jgi:hypothetical protein
MRATLSIHPFEEIARRITRCSTALSEVRSPSLAPCHKPLRDGSFHMQPSGCSRHYPKGGLPPWPNCHALVPPL